MNRWLVTTLLVLGGMPSLDPALAGEQAIDRASVPAPVTQTVTARYPKYIVTDVVLETEEGAKPLYEVRLTHSGEQLDVEIDEAGKVISEERPVALKTVPKAVLKALTASQYKGWQVNKSEKLTNLAEPAKSGFELVVEKEGKQRDLLFSPQGKILKDEERDEVSMEHEAPPQGP